MSGTEEPRVMREWRPLKVIDVISHRDGRGRRITEAEYEEQKDEEEEGMRPHN